MCDQNARRPRSLPEALTSSAKAANLFCLSSVDCIRMSKRLDITIAYLPYPEDCLGSYLHQWRKAWRKVALVFGNNFWQMLQLLNRWWRRCVHKTCLFTVLNALAASTKRTASDCFLSNSSFKVWIAVSLLFYLLPAFRPRIWDQDEALTTSSLVTLMTVFPVILHSTLPTPIGVSPGATRYHVGYLRRSLTVLPLMGLSFPAISIHFKWPRAFFRQIKPFLSFRWLDWFCLFKQFQKIVLFSAFKSAFKNSLLFDLFDGFKKRRAYFNKLFVNFFQQRSACDCGCTRAEKVHLLTTQNLLHATLQMHNSKYISRNIKYISCNFVII